MAHVDEIAEIPNSVRRGTEVRLAGVKVASTRAYGLRRPLHAVARDIRISVARDIRISVFAHLLTFPNTIR